MGILLGLGRVDLGNKGKEKGNSFPKVIPGPAAEPGIQSRCAELALGLWQEGGPVNTALPRRGPPNGFPEPPVPSGAWLQAPGLLCILEKDEPGYLWSIFSLRASSKPCWVDGEWWDGG